MKQLNDGEMTQIIGGGIRLDIIDSGILKPNEAFSDDDADGIEA